MREGVKTWWIALGLAAAACTPTASLEPGESLPGGETTLSYFLGSNSFSLPAANLSSERRADFFTGNSFFNQAWVTAPASTDGRDGLGPTFNARSCSACHFKDGRGEPGEGPVPSDALLFRLSIPGTPVPELGIVPEPVYGDQLGHFSLLGVPAEGRIHVTYEEQTFAYADGEPYTLLVPHYEVASLAFGPMHPDVQISPRIAPTMLGLGLLEAISDATLESLADPDDADGDGVSGRLNRVWSVESGALRHGRFGWKAEQPSVRQQAAGALLGDLGLTTTLFPDENCPPEQVACSEAPNGGTPEVKDETLARMTFYSRTLALPPRREADAPEILAGKHLFKVAGCDLCHTPMHVTGTLEGMPELSNQRIWPYTDLLLHDLGPGLADGRPIFDASGSEWRTPPLWGLGLVPMVNGHQRLLHDGRARGFAEAILWHGGEAESARETFRHMTRAERTRLIAFLESL